MITTIFQTILAVAQAVPMVKDMIDEFLDFWMSKQIEAAQGKIATREQKRLQLRKSIRWAQTDDERIVLSKILSDYNNN